MIEVFKTDVEHQHQAAMLAGILMSRLSLRRVDFDIDDCDRIMRVEGESIMPSQIIDIMSANGHSCNVLE